MGVTINILSAFADVFGIISFLITGVLFLTAKSLKKKIEELNGFFHFTSDKETIKKELLTIKGHIMKHGISHNHVRNIIIVTRKMEPYQKYMTESDKQSLRKISDVIDRGFITNDQSDLITHILKLVGFFDSNHNFNLENI